MRPHRPSAFRGGPGWQADDVVNQHPTVWRTSHPDGVDRQPSGP